jgi:hypothetical protein
LKGAPGIHVHHVGDGIHNVANVDALGNASDLFENLCAEDAASIAIERQLRLMVAVYWDGHLYLDVPTPFVPEVRP